MRTGVSLIAIAVCVAASAFSQEKPQRNLETCLSGKYPALCDHRALTPDQLQRPVRPRSARTSQCASQANIRPYAIIRS